MVLPAIVEAPVKGFKSVSAIAFQKGSAIATVESVMTRYPLPPKKGAKKEEKKADKDKAPPEPKIPETLTLEKAMSQAVSWGNSNNIAGKFAVGTLTTAKYQERAAVFDKMNDKARDNVGLLPQQSYFGKTPDPTQDPYNRRKVKQLNDISFEESESGEDEVFEATKNLQRLPQTVLTEENLKVYLTNETEKLDLEHSYWLKDVFLDKIGRMAPNLKYLSLRRLKISDKAFTEIMTHLRVLERVDISDCANIYEGGMRKFLSNNKDTLQQLQASNMPKAITNSIVDLISQASNLNFLDISHAKQVTDEGLLGFKERKMGIKKLFVNGLTAITAAGLTEVINSCKGSLRILEAALMDQETMTGAFCHALSQAFSLEELDLSGDSSIGDDGIAILPKGETKDENGKTLEVIGLPRLRVLKLNGLVKTTDHSLLKLCQTSRVLEHIELTKCELLTEYSIDGIIKGCTNLVFLDLNGIPAVTPAQLEVFRQLRPELMIRRYLYQNIDPKDNDLRVPRRLMGEKKKKKKGKKGGKKKK